MAKTDWQYHIDNYLENYASSMTLAQYADANGLNPNTARREMKPAINVALASLPADQKPSSKRKTPPRPTAEPATQDATIKVGKLLRGKVRAMSAEQRTTRGERDQNSDQNSDQNGSDQNFDQRAAGKSGRSKKGEDKPEPAPDKAPGKGRGKKKGGDTRADHSASARDQNFRDHCPTRPNDAANVTVYGSFGGAHTLDFGGYCSLLEMDDDIVSLAVATGMDNRDLILAQGRYMTMYRKQNQILKRMEEDYSSAPWVDDEGMPMPKDQAEAQAIFGTSQRMTELEAAIARHKLGLMKLELDRQKQAIELRKQALAEWNRHPMPLADRIERTRALMLQREEQGLSALDTARLFDLESLEYPPSLHAEMLKEVTWIEPTADQEGGVTDDELEAESRAYREQQRQVREEWLPARNEEIAAIIANEAAHQAGELLQEDDFNGTGDGVLVDEDDNWTPDDALPDEDDAEPDAEPVESW